MTLQRYLNKKKLNYRKNFKVVVDYPLKLSKTFDRLLVSIGSLDLGCKLSSKLPFK